MTFVFSFWYIVIAVLALGVVACIAGFVLMDKKDKVIIKEFVDTSSVPETAKEQPVQEKAE